jgi:cytochrome c553
MRRALAVAALGAVVCAGCRQDMHDQPKVKPQSASSFYPDGRGARPLIEGTVMRSAVLGDAPYLTGKQGGKPIPVAPVPVTAEALARGRERYDIFCSPCHDRVGNGQGMIVQRGYRKPTSLHADYLREEADGYFFVTISNGFGVMPNYAQQIPVADRWAITLYIRALQLSQHAALTDLPESERTSLTAADH